ncbi:site-specific integrase [Photobacterium alginatilyticum]|uniref:Site-specific integrase n=1 Tax=Photobacterium alginatilyticum TaxID=1775171 RepID=A0ABW9YLR9_9GAMM|nr:site-specific integrase [Photobacterium alginatilyticum]NBI54201.1 site-specific integrase [Photobacterium alginatilyticum]
MPIEKLLNERDVQELINANSYGEYAHRNVALLMGGLYWGLLPIELSKLKLEHVMHQSGEFFKVWVLPKHVAYNGVARELQTSDHILQVFESYVEWRIGKSIGVSNLSSYRGLSPDTAFFRNDRGEPFAVTGSLRNGTTYYQPRSMTEMLKRFIAKTSLQGVTPSTLRDSWIKQMWDLGCGYSDLQAISGIQSKSTLDRKVRPTEHELEGVFKSIYGRVKFPKEG